MIHGLPRFSEDLDFSLEKPITGFSLMPYMKDIERELAAYGFDVVMEAREKRQSTPTGRRGIMRNRPP